MKNIKRYSRYQKNSKNCSPNDKKRLENLNENGFATRMLNNLSFTNGSLTDWSWRRIRSPRSPPLEQPFLSESYKNSKVCPFKAVQF